jgi:hypothetical protein
MKNDRVGPAGLQILLAVLAVAAVTGCMANYGRLTYDQTVTQTFADGQALDDHRYFYSGRQNKPSAIIGIDPAFEFVESKYWTAIGPSQIPGVVGRLFPEYGFLSGAYILAPDGRTAGVWYSWVKVFSAKFDDNRISVSSPEMYADRRGGGVYREP